MSTSPEAIDLLSYEREQWLTGCEYVAGIDEVGRGPLAGPVVAAAVVFPKDCAVIPFVNDSKQLSETRRLEIRDNLLEVEGIQYGLGEVNVQTIDEINILKSAHLAMKKAIGTLSQVEFALIDGLPIANFPVKNLAIVKGDSKSASIAAASILAKIYRDELMSRYAVTYPEYGFERNKGYGTKEHLKALAAHGPCSIHRKSFAPVRKALGLEPIQMELF